MKRSQPIRLERWPPRKPDGDSKLAAMTTLAIPVVLSELGWVARAWWTPSWWATRPAAIGAVALATLFIHSVALGIGLVLGLDTLVAQAYGRRDHEDVIAAGPGVIWPASHPRYAADCAVTRLRNFGIVPQAPEWLAATCACSTGALYPCCCMAPRDAICKVWVRSASSL